MDWWGPSSRIEQVDLGDELVFSAVPLRRLGPIVLSALVVVGAIVFEIREFSFGALFVGVGAAFFHGRELFYGKSQVLTVTATHLSGADLVCWKDIFELRYQVGGEDDPSGLCARRSRWESVSLMSNVNCEQPEQMMHAIYTKFPLVEMAPRPEDLGTKLKKLLDRF